MPSARAIDGSRSIDHPAWRDGQLSTLRCGLDALDHPRLEAVLVTLVDVPLVSPDTVRALMREWRDDRRADRPSRAG